MPSLIRMSHPYSITTMSAGDTFSSVINAIRKAPDELAFADTAQRLHISPHVARMAAVYACESAANQFPVNTSIRYLENTIAFEVEPEDTPPDIRLMYQKFVTGVVRNFFVHGYCAVTIAMQGSTEKEGYYPVIVDPHLYIPVTAQELLEAAGTSQMQQSFRGKPMPMDNDYIKILRKHLPAAYIGEDLYALFHDTTFMQQVMEGKVYRPIIFQSPDYVRSVTGFPTSRVGGLLHSLDIYTAAHINMRPSNVLVFAPSGAEVPHALSASSIIALGLDQHHQIMEAMGAEQAHRSMEISSKAAEVLDTEGRSRGISIITVPVDDRNAKLQYVVPDQGAMSRNIAKLFEQLLMAMGIPPGSFDTRGHSGSEMDVTSQHYLRRLSSDVMDLVVETLRSTNKGRVINIPKCRLSVYIKPFALRELASVQGTRAGEEASKAWGHEGAVNPYIPERPDHPEPPRKRPRTK